MEEYTILSTWLKTIKSWAANMAICRQNCIISILVFFIIFTYLNPILNIYVNMFEIVEHKMQLLVLIICIWVLMHWNCQIALERGSWNHQYKIQIPLPINCITLQKCKEWVGSWTVCLLCSQQWFYTYSGNQKSLYKINWLKLIDWSLGSVLYTPMLIWIKKV